MIPVVFHETTHNHEVCITSALNKAIDLCQQRDSHLTTLRYQVLELVWRSHKPLGAYAILECLQNTQGRPAAPPTVYRALDFLLSEGLIHRIASLNAFVGCIHPDHPHVGQFLICESCGNAAEVDDPNIHSDIKACAQKLGFSISKETVEVSGYCPQCQHVAHPHE
jgi:Fur family zinc uptake transcriptional regulator